MSAEQLEVFEQLARRAVACKRWRWMPGMLTTNGWRVVWRDKDGYTTAYGNGYRTYLTQVTNKFCPDLTDPATIGCLLALVREAWGPTFHLIPQGGWLAQGARLPNGATVNLGLCTETEAAALVAALEVAP